MNEDILLDFIKNKVTETVTEEVTTVVTDELVATTEMSVEDQAWGVVDIMLDTGAAEGIAGALGAPLAIIIGIKVFRQWRRKMKEAEKQNG
jgi:hypothetical protein